MFRYDLNDQVNGVWLNVSNPSGMRTPPPNITYDANGNRTSFVSDTYQINNLNQYTQRNGTTAVYDNDGNLITGVDGSTYTYDAQNRLLTAAKGNTTMSFTYDGLNRQVRRSVSGQPDTSFSRLSIARNWRRSVRLSLSAHEVSSQALS